ncbi:transcriptional regulator [Bacillus toyonensis]|uniref:transcriptional regulator n=1 Tax=Bacillus toyonensis TaxID=155322 RepID=UPI000BFC8169|nr:transcriptional regulator [Bacillus toyonensis]PHE64443.1 transcriptional regulator [Bacillus toyonensis]
MSIQETNKLREAVLLWAYRKDSELTNEELVSKVGVTIESLNKELIRLGLISINEELNKAVDLYLNRYNLGLTMDEIAEQECISKSTLYMELKNRGIDCKRVGKTYSQRDLNQAVSLFLNRGENGMMVKDILDKTGITDSVLYSELRRKNIDCSKPSNVEGVESAINLYKDRKKHGLKVNDILERTKISSQTLYSELKHRGIELRGRKKKSA